MATHAIKEILLSNGKKMPIIGLGTFRSNNAEEMTHLIRTALDVGYRHIDTAKYYQNEDLIGIALKQIFSEGKYKREDIFLTTKILPFNNVTTLEVVQKQLKDLQVDYVDLLLIHFPITPPGENLQWTHKPVHVQWAEFEEIYNKGLTKSIGVSNFNAQMVVDLLSYCKVKPVVNQIELHVFNQQRRFVEFLKKIHVYPVAYSPMAKYRDIVNNETILAIGKKYNASVAQVLISFLAQQDIIVIPKTEKPERLKHNLESYNLKFSEEDNEILRKLNSNTRLVNVDTNAAFYQGVPLFD